MKNYHVPDDFPRPTYLGAVSGAQPKVLLVRREDGTFGAPGVDSDVLHDRWQYCEQVIEQLRVKSLESAAGKRAHMTHEAILIST